MKATPPQIEKYLAALAQTPQQIARVTKGLEETRLQFRTDPKAWSINDILAHLRSCADLWTHSIYAMLAANVPVFSDIDERKWANVTHYVDVAFHESLQAFSLQRQNLSRVLSRLPLEAWERSALIFERKHTVFTQVRRMAKHENEHCQQIESLLEKRDK